MTSVWMFPGQGSQKLGMGEEVFDAYPELVSTADEILGYSIKELCLEDPNDCLSQTQYTQPALYTVGALMSQEQSGPPSIAIGHSLGEYNALLAAEVFDFETGLRLVQKRGALMAEATGGGMSAIIGLNDSQISSVLESEGLSSIDIANYNSPKQIVISGPSADLPKANDCLKSAGAKLVVPLKVSAAFHSRYMETARDSFRNFLNTFTFNTPTATVYANISTNPYDATNIIENLSDQITGSVRWTDTITKILAETSDPDWIEIGPGNVLAGLLKQIKKG